MICFYPNCMIKRYLVFFSFLFCVICTQGQETINYNQLVSLSSSELSFQKILDEITFQTELSFSYSSSVIKPNKAVQLAKSDGSLRDILIDLSASNNIDYLEFKGKILFIERTDTWEDFWIYGYINDEASGEALISAIVYNFTDKTITETNEFGYYAIKLKSKNPIIKISFLGYETIVLEKVNRKFPRLDYVMRSSLSIPNIIITPYDTLINIREAEEIFEGSTKNVNPGLLGENDIMQSIKFQPGIQSGSEVQGNVFVRGGGSDQNLILMDGVPLYEVNHLLGLTSVFNEDAVNDVEISTSGFGAKYGGRLSSVINVQIKNGNKFKHIGSATLGLLGAKIHFEGPINKGETSYIFTARSSYINVLVEPIARRFLSLDETNFGYQDLNLKVHHNLTKNNSISIGTYLGSDKIGFAGITNDEEPIPRKIADAKNEISWGNRVFNVRFNQIINKKLFFNISASVVNYSLRSRSSNVYFNYEGDSTTVSELDVFAISVINDNNLKTDWEYKANNDHSILFGGGFTNHVYNPSVISRDEIITDVPSQSDGILANERFIYLQDQLDISQYLRLRAGFHLSQFFVEESEFSSFQPRIELSVFPDKRSDLSFSYSKMTQFVHLLVNPGTGLPSDLWLPSTEKILPEESVQFSSRYNRIWNDKVISNISFYYKQLDNLIEYVSPAPLFTPIINDSKIVNVINDARDWEDRVVIGRGIAYGVDFFTAYNSDLFKASVAYSYGQSNRQFDAINRGEPFPFRYDRRHDLSITSNYNLSNKLTIGANWVYGSGHTTTLATREQLTPEGPILDVSVRNNFRLPAYHRLDLNLKYSKKLTSKLDMEFVLGVYNLYNRLNPYFVYLYKDVVKDQFSVRQVGLFPILPFFNVRIAY